MSRGLYRARMVLTLLSLLACLAPHHAFGADPWPEFARCCLDPGGRVIDDGQGGISHSEGQGAAMLLAATAHDRAAFDRIWNWTRREMLVREDGLLAWRWSPETGITDRNNATDGDLFVAWALARAHAVWHDEAYRDAGARLAAAIRSRLIRPSSFGSILLPGAEGFEQPDGIVINLSYWIFPAFRALDAIDPAPEWSALEKSGLALLDAARFGRWQLPPDWTLVRGDKLSPAPAQPARFGYDAVRIPLYLNWAKLATRPRFASFAGFWQYFDGARFLPAWTLLTDDSVDSRDAPPGMHAVAAFCRGRPIPGNKAGAGYYSTFLHALTLLAAREAPR